VYIEIGQVTILDHSTSTSMSIETPISGVASSAIPEKPYGIIYCATNRINGKRYIGQTIGPLSRRKIDHKYSAKKYRHRFANAIKVYGIDGFIWEEIDTGFSREELNNLERYWIQFYQSHGRDKGYNLDEGGNSHRHQNETKHKISRTKKHRFAMGMTKSFNRGMPMTQEQRAKISQIKTTPKTDKRRPSPATEIKKGQHLSPKTQFPSVPIHCVENNKTYSSITEASRELGISHANFSMYLKGNRKSVAGCQWKRL